MRIGHHHALGTGCANYIGRWQTAFEQYQQADVRVWRRDTGDDDAGDNRADTIKERRNAGRRDTPVDLTTGTGYDSQWSLMQYLFVWLDLRLYFYYAHQQWLDPSSEMKNMLGLVVTREEFEHQLAKAAQLGLEEALTPEEAAQMSEAQRTLAVRLARTGQTDIPLLRLFERCGLDAFEQSCVILTYAAVLDRKYEKLLAYLQDDMSWKDLRTALAVQLFLPKGGNMEQFLARFAGDGRFAGLFERESLWQGILVLHPLVLEYLSSGRLADRPGLTVFDGAVQHPDGGLIIQRNVAQRLDRTIKQKTACVVCLRGGPGSGKRFQTEHLYLAGIGAACLLIWREATGRNRRSRWCISWGN